MSGMLAIVPAHNEVEAIAATIAAIQPFASEFDVLVVDDGSDDATAELARATGAPRSACLWRFEIGRVKAGQTAILRGPIDTVCKPWRLSLNGSSPWGAFFR